MNKIKPTKLAPGYYRLKQTVQNPHIDKRVKRDWWLLPEIPKDARFMVSHRMTESIHDNSDYREVSVKRVWRDGTYSYVGFWSDGDKGTERWNLIAANLEPCEEDLRGLLARTGYENMEFSILQELLNSGKLTLADVEAAGKIAYDKLE